MKICIMGAPVNCGNRGVMALGASLVNLCSEAAADVEIVLLLGNCDNQPAPFYVDGHIRLIPVVNCRLSPRSRPCDHLLWILSVSALYRLLPVAAVRRIIARCTPWIKAIESADMVGDVRGGDSFSDIYGLKGFLLSFLMVWTVILVKGTMVQFPQTYGPFKSPVARWLARHLLKRSSVIIARDRESQRIAQELIGAGREVLLSPDVAFSLTAVVPNSIELDPPREASAIGNQQSGMGWPSTQPIGLNVNGLMFNGGYTRNNMFGLSLDYAEFLAKLVAALLAEHPGELWLVPHTYAPRGSVESDNEASEKLRAGLPAALRNRVRLVTGEYDCHQIKGVIGQCDFFVGSRMHACIAALSQCIPCVGVAYSRKFSGVFAVVGMEDWIVDARNSTEGAAVAQIISLYRRRSAARQGLMTHLTQARRSLKDVFHLFLNRNSLIDSNSQCVL
jgi:colanic acid/amylovoran biosynthesis protein